MPFSIAGPPNTRPPIARSPIDGAPTTASPVLSAELLTRIRELNLDYIELLAAENNSPDRSAQLRYLTPRLVAAIAALSSDARRALANAPFTLYSLGFEDERFWRAACADERPSIEQRYAPPVVAWPQGSFCQAALVQAWCIVNSNPLAARVVYAMPAGIMRLLATLRPWRISRIAHDHSELLAPRWPGNLAFWPDLLRFAGSNDARRLRTALLLGHQLIASELEAAPGRAPRRVDLRSRAAPRTRE